MRPEFAQTDPQTRARRGFGRAAVEIDLIHKGIKTVTTLSGKIVTLPVEIDLIHKGIKTLCVEHLRCSVHYVRVEIDLIHKGIKTNELYN